jgi:hypothetical protein
MPPSMASTARETGTDLLIAPGIMLRITLFGSCAKLPRTMSVSMKPK